MKERLDVVLVVQGLAPSREQAKLLIKGVKQDFVVAGHFSNRMKNVYGFPYFFFSSVSDCFGRFSFFARRTTL